MLVYAIIAIAIAAIFSLVIAFIALRGKSVPWVISLLQLLAGGGGLWLVYNQVMGGEDKVMLPFGVLAVALLAALIVMFRQSKGLALLNTVLWLLGGGLLIAMVFIHNLTY